MKPETEELIGSLSVTEISAVARQAVGDPAADLIDWQPHPLQESGRRMIIRFTGRTHRSGREERWSAILKVTDGRETVGDPYGGYREPIVYTSDFFADLPCRLGIPRCYGIIKRQETPDLLWIEDVPDSEEGEWPADRLGEAAFCIGQFNGATTKEDCRPDWPWLSGTTQIPDFVNRFVPDCDELAVSLDYWRKELGLHREHTDRLLRLCQERGLYLEYLDVVPSSICHGDADRRNFLFNRRTDDGRDFIAIDWTMAGLSVLGDDSQNLVFGSVLHFGHDSAKLEELDGIVFERYIEGAVSAGWSGDERLVRLGHTCCSALKWGLALGGGHVVNVHRAAISSGRPEEAKSLSLELGL